MNRFLNNRPQIHTSNNEQVLTRACSQAVELTSCVRTACSSCRKRFEQAVNNLQQAGWDYQICYKVVPTRLTESWRSSIDTALRCQLCDNLV